MLEMLQITESNDVTIIAEKCFIELNGLLGSSNITVKDINPENINFWICNFCDLMGNDDDLRILLLSDRCWPNKFSYITVLYILYSMIFLFSILGNAFVIYAAGLRLRGPTNAFIANMAMGDFIMIVACVPYTLIIGIHLQYWPNNLPDAFCPLFNFVQASSVFVSAYSVVAISVDRFRAIVYPFKSKCSSPSGKRTIFLIWTTSFLTALPVAIFSRLEDVESRPYLFFERYRCLEVWPQSGTVQYYTLLLSVLQYFLPMTTSLFTHTAIAKTVWGRKKKVITGVDSHYKETHRENIQDSFLLRKNLRRASSSSKVLTDFNETVIREWYFYRHLWVAFHWTAMAHAACNPLVIVFTNAKFKILLFSLLKNSRAKFFSICNG